MTVRRNVHALGDTPDRTVTAKTRKRCPQCNRMIEAGEPAILSDDRSLESCPTYRTPGMKQYKRGAWHLWHVACRADHLTAVAAIGQGAHP